MIASKYTAHKAGLSLNSEEWKNSEFAVLIDWLREIQSKNYLVIASSKRRML